MSNVTSFKRPVGPSISIAYDTLIRLQELEFISEADNPKDCVYVSEEDQVLTVTEFESGKRLIEVTALP